MFQKLRTIHLRNTYESEPLPVLHHAAATVQALEGKLVPILLVDTSNRPDIEEYIKIHDKVSTGDVRSTWGRKPSAKAIYQLILEVIRPVELGMYFEFKFPQFISTIDHIICAECVAIQPARIGEELSTTFLTSTRVILEVPDMGFRSRWDRKLHKYYERKFRNDGLRRRDAAVAADKFIAERRAMIDFQLTA